MEAGEDEERGWKVEERGRGPSPSVCASRRIAVDYAAAAVFYALTTRDSPFLILYYIGVLNGVALLFLHTVNIIFDGARLDGGRFYGIEASTVARSGTTR